jgi:hypothetical protein
MQDGRDQFLGPITGFDDVLESILNVTEHLSQP